MKINGFSASTGGASMTSPFNKLNSNIMTSFIEGQDDDDHYNLKGDLQICGIM
jgi:hypothetical protein